MKALEICFWLVEWILILALAPVTLLVAAGVLLCSYIVAWRVSRSPSELNKVALRTGSGSLKWLGT